MPTTNDDTAYKLTLVKSFPYRDAREEYSNSYHLLGDPPADRDAWAGLANMVISLERHALSGETKYERAYGYLAGSNQSVAQLADGTDWADLSGNFVPTGGARVAPGDSAAWVRWLTPDLTQYGKKIYLRKYFHGIYVDLADPDKVFPAQRAALLTFASAMTDDAEIGATHICGPTGSPGGASSASMFLTTRTLKRRGKRPPRSTA